MLRRDSRIVDAPKNDPRQQQQQQQPSSSAPVKPPYHFLIEAASGGGAGAISRTLMAPLERVKVLLQIQETNAAATNYKGIWDCLTRIPREQEGGILAYWRGNGVNVARMIPNSAIKFSTFDYLKSVAFPLGEQAYADEELLYRKLLCGALSGVVTLVPVYPIDLIRTRLTADMNEVKRYRGVVDCVKQTVRRDANNIGGISALYKGLSVSLFGIIPYLALSLTMYDTLKKAAADRHDFFKTPLGLVSLGSISAIISQTITFPMDTVRRRMQVSGVPGQPHHKSTLDCIAHVYKTSGMRGFYRGVLANGLRSAPQTGIEFACYDLIRKYLAQALA